MIDSGGNRVATVFSPESLQLSVPLRDPFNNRAQSQSASMQLVNRETKRVNGLLAAVNVQRVNVTVCLLSTQTERPDDLFAI